MIALDYRLGRANEFARCAGELRDAGRLELAEIYRGLSRREMERLRECARGPLTGEEIVAGYSANVPSFPEQVITENEVEEIPAGDISEERAALYFGDYGPAR